MSGDETSADDASPRRPEQEAQDSKKMAAAAAAGPAEPVITKQGAAAVQEGPPLREPPAAVPRDAEAAAPAPRQVKARVVEPEDLEDEELEDDVETVSEENLEFVSDDPLAPAYDLERGAPLNKQEATEPGRAPWRSEVRSAKEFFTTEVLYRFDIIEPPERVPMVARYRIELRGANGGVWTIIIGEDIEVVNRKEDADVILIMQHRDFLQIVNGTLNPQLAILAQKIKIQGDVKKAVLLQNILAPLPE